ncbi:MULTISPECIES: nucleotidyltransferase domain-containing protein [Streptomyces]|uniref:Nucleotidyltransferase domain-containing protein n=1 Tax=Streptomyces edwardsiae TaxID=3075527 RepID=A0ABU2Q2T8_9ACTN|nr:nucleotidyltransferase domain-containing protein [Streptomyces sp. DSM 41636]MDT0398736.1 nucleotidyltransferase domain-containing protein [Streptomyces sp. DSM 41636]
MSGTAGLPREVRAYAEELVRRTRAVCGPRLVSVFAVGSLALGDYRHGRSDIDVTVVVDRSLPGRALSELAGVLAHPGLACPAAGLELVVYPADAVGRPSGRAGYLMDLNTGPSLPERVSYDAEEASAFWYVLDRSVARQAGLPLFGAPVRDVIAAPGRGDVLTALRASVREHAEGDGHVGDNRVLNGCRSVVWCRTGRWVAKRRAGEVVAASEARFRPLIRSASRSFELPRESAPALPVGDVREFLAWVAGRVDEAAGPCQGASGTG